MSSEISVILKNTAELSRKESQVLYNCALPGKTFTIIQRPDILQPFTLRRRAIEYIFDPEGLLVFTFVSSNIFVKWPTDSTRHIKPFEEIHIVEEIYLYYNPLC